MVEPRRVATRSAAQQMSSLLNQSIGQTVGYTIRGESQRNSSTTKVTVMTEGILMQRLRRDPELKGVDAVILDEFHERGLGGDVVLALCREVQLNLREDLKIVVMSATLLGRDTEGEGNKNNDILDVETTGMKLLRTLGGLDSCNILTSQGRQYPIEIYHHAPIQPQERSKHYPPHATLLRDGKLLTQTMVHAIIQGLHMAPSHGNVLVFLPGAREIRHVCRALQEEVGMGGGIMENVQVMPLYGALSKEEQDLAISNSDGAGRRRVIISSPIAEASLTIPGVTCVIDSGLRREPRYDADTGLPRLVTVPCSRDSAIQRAGRAGRTQEGCCIRLYTEGEFKSSKFPNHAVPEVLSCDLVPTVLLLAEWGYSSIEEIREELPFVDTPPIGALQKAMQMLIDLKALEENKELNSNESLPLNEPWPVGKRFKMSFHGQKLVRMPTHPRLATCIARAKEAVDSLRGPAILVAAVIASALLDDELSGLMPRQRNNADLSFGVRALLEGGERANSANALIKYASRIGSFEENKITEAFQNKIPHQEVLDSLGDALLPGFIDLVAEYKGEASYGGSTYMLSLGRSARLDGVADVGDFIIVLDTSTGDDGKTRIRSYVRTSQDSLLEVAVETDDIFTVPSRGHEVRARRVLKVGSLELSSTPLPSPSTEAVTRVLLETIKKLGGVNVALVQSQSKKKKQAIDGLRERVGLAVKMTSPEEWPGCFEQLDNGDFKHSVDEDVLMSLVEPWLAVTSSLKSLDIYQILLASFSVDQLSRLNTDFPTEIEAPDGSKIPVNYSDGIPMTSAKLQQFFGATASPTIGPQHNTMPISISLLSPSGKPLAQTRDLPFFWNDVYPSVRAEMRGRYPKHPWPEDPMSAIPTRLSKRQQNRLSEPEQKIDPRKAKSKQRRRK